MWLLWREKTKELGEKDSSQLAVDGLQLGVKKQAPPPCFCVCTGIIELTGEFLGCMGMIGLSGSEYEGEEVGRSEMAQEPRPLSIADGA